MSSLKLSGQVILTPTSGIQNILETISLMRNNYDEGDGFSTAKVAASGSKSLNFVDSPTAGGTLFIMFSDQPLNMFVNGSSDIIPANELTVITGSATSGDLIDSISIQNLNAIAEANVRYMLVK